MIKIKLTQRQRYEHMYRMLRQGAKLEIDEDMPQSRKDAIKAADYSYDNRNQVFSGWKNWERRSSFTDYHVRLAINGWTPI